MPIKIRCSICHRQSPRRGFAGRMKWLRHHRSTKHPTAFRKSIQKGLKTRRKAR
jgi:hypothetical protein